MLHKQKQSTTRQQSEQNLPKTSSSSISSTVWSSSRFESALGACTRTFRKCSDKFPPAPHPLLSPRKNNLPHYDAVWSLGTPLGSGWSELTFSCRKTVIVEQFFADLKSKSVRVCEFYWEQCSCNSKTRVVYCNSRHNNQQQEAKRTTNKQISRDREIEQFFFIWLDRAWPLRAFRAQFRAQNRPEKAQNANSCCWWDFAWSAWLSCLSSCRTVASVCAQLPLSISLHLHLALGERERLI